MIQSKKTARRNGKSKNQLLRLYLRYFTPLTNGGSDDKASLVQPSPLQEVPSYATNGVRQPTPTQ